MVHYMASFMSPANTTLLDELLDEASPFDNPKFGPELCQGLLHSIMEDLAVYLPYQQRYKGVALVEQHQMFSQIGANTAIGTVNVTLH